MFGITWGVEVIHRLLMFFFDVWMLDVGCNRACLWILFFCVFWWLETMTIRIKTNACFDPIGFFAGRACRRPQTRSGEHQPIVVDVGARDLGLGGEAWAHSLPRQVNITFFLTTIIKFFLTILYFSWQTICIFPDNYNFSWQTLHIFLTANWREF